jgi:uncharacterized protein (DUF488 family)
MSKRTLPPQEAHWQNGTVFTVGHSTLPIEKFIALMKVYNIARVVDIRTIPRSRHNPQFNSESLSKSLPENGIAYEHVAALGGLRRPSKDSANTGWRNESFRGYADYMQTAAFQTALETLIQSSRQARIVIMCAEAVPWRCHRSLVADALEVHGIPVIEILSEDSYRAHRLTEFAHVEGTKVSYPPAQATLL